MINIVKDEVVELPLPRLLLRMKDILASQMREFQTLDEDGTFKKHPEYPEFAWLEGLVNAVTHRLCKALHNLCYAKLIVMQSYCRIHWFYRKSGSFYFA